MKYNFDELINRRGISSVKWDVKDNELPMWVADMDFSAPPELLKAMKDRIDNGTFGYNLVDDEWKDAYINHWAKRGLKFNRDEIIFSTGVIASISSIVRRVTEVANNVVLLTPIYNTFFNSIVNNGRHPLESEMIYKDGTYYIDWEDLETKLSNEETSLFIFCNPHNPTGRVWTKDEIVRIGALCNKYNVTVISDEIHCDLLKPGVSYTPFASVNETNANISITTIAPTKTFNLAGIQTSAIVCKNKKLMHLVDRGLNTDECAEPNTFALLAPKVVFNECDEWLSELNIYIDENRKYVRDYINNNLKDYVRLVEGDALYLLWLDLSKITHDSKEFCDFLRKETGLYLAEGIKYRGNGFEFLRMNIGTQKERVKDAMERLSKGIKLYLKKN